MVASRKRRWKREKEADAAYSTGAWQFQRERKQHILIGLSYRSDGCIFLWHNSQSSKTIFYPTEDWVLRTLIPQWSTTVSKQLSPSSSTANRAALRCGCNSLFGGARPDSLLSSLFSSSLSFFPNPPPRAFPSPAKKKLPVELIRELNHCVFGAAIRSVCTSVVEARKRCVCRRRRGQHGTRAYIMTGETGGKKARRNPNLLRGRKREACGIVEMLEIHERYWSRLIIRSGIGIDFVTESSTVDIIRNYRTDFWVMQLGLVP